MPVLAAGHMLTRSVVRRRRAWPRVHSDTKSHALGEAARWLYAPSLILSAPDSVSTSCVCLVRLQGRRARSATTPRGRVWRQRARQQPPRLRTMPRRAPRREPVQPEAAGMAEGAGPEAAADTQEGTLAEAAGDRVRRKYKR